MTDLIKRKDAITVLYRNTPFDANGIALLDKCESEINAIPSADRPQGEWIEVDDSLISCKCSICGWESHMHEDDVYGMPYCPNCGTRMKGINDEM